MKAYQRMIREEKARALGTFPPADLSTAVIKRISYHEAAKIILEYEWLGSMGTTEYAFGLHFGDVCGGVACFGRTAGTNVYKSAFGEEYKKQVITLCRGACVYWAHEHSASKLIATACKLMGEYGYHAFIAYSDPAAGEIGTVYQACNWLYCGMTHPTEQFITPDGKTKDARLVHAYTRDRRGGTLKYKRTRAEQKEIMKAEGCVFIKGHAKHRYVGIYGEKHLRQTLREHLQWPVLPYPKRLKEADEITPGQ